jgi:hypothetical protein
MQGFFGNLPLASSPDWLNQHSTLLVGVVGILVSGLIGPSVAALWVNRRERQRDHFALIDMRRQDLRGVIDETAKLLGGAVHHLRHLVVAEKKGEELPPDSTDLLRELVPLGQRLQLRLPRNHEVIRFYDDACTGLRNLAKQTSKDDFDKAADNFEAQREVFLNAGRKVLLAPVSMKVEI